MRKTVLVIILLLVTVTAAFAGDLEDVQNSGRLRFGTWPAGMPFVFYDSGDELTGIDISLMEEIARRMGVELEIVEITSEDMVNSLEIGQVDIIGAALSKTDERRGKIGFSRVYYALHGTFAGPKHMPIMGELNAETIAGMRIGVRKGSGLEQWLRSELLEDGTVQARDIYTYSTTESAMKALDRGRVDLVLMDAAIYDFFYADSGNYKSWDYGSPEDEYAFGLRDGSDLRTEINRHLLDMLNDGTAQQVADSFFSLQKEEDPVIRPVTRSTQPSVPTAAVLPTAYLEFPNVLPEPTATSVPAATCSYSIAYVSDVTIPDGYQVYGGYSFTKTWRVKNTGNCPWTTDFTWAFVSGSQMSGMTRNLPRTVYPGETIDLSVDMIAPYTAGIYRGDWQLKTPGGYSIGPVLWVQIVVPGSNSGPTAVPTPTAYYYGYPGEAQPAAKPEILWFYPNFYTQEVGKCVNVYWGVTNNSTAELTVDGVSVYFGAEESYQIQLCSEVQSFGPHYIKLCAYGTGGETCETVLYTTDPAGTPFSP